MNSIFTIHAVLIDTQNGSRKTHLLLKGDTIRNRTDIYQLSDSLIDENNDIDAQIKELFDLTPDYQVQILSDLITKLTDELGGIDVGGQHIDGRQALQLVHEDHFDEVIDAIVKALSKKNLIFTIPGLLNALKDSYKTDLPLAEAIKTFISEIPELGDWQIELVKIDDKTQIH